MKAPIFLLILLIFWVTGFEVATIHLKHALRSCPFCRLRFGALRRSLLLRRVLCALLSGILANLEFRRLSTCERLPPLSISGSNSSKPLMGKFSLA